MTTEPNFAHCTYLEETWSFIDCPGSIELALDVRSALMGVDVAVVVAPPEPARCLTLAPIFKLLDRKSVVLGQSVSVRVHLGGRSIIKKKTTQETTIQYTLTYTHH